MYADRSVCLRCLSKWYRNDREYLDRGNPISIEFPRSAVKQRRRVRCRRGPHETTRARSRPRMRGDDRILRAVKHACYDYRKIWDGRDFLLGYRCFETPPGPEYNAVGRLKVRSGHRV